MHKVVAIILAGGRGKRMDLLCYNRPKPVLPFAGKFRVIDFTLSNCMHSDISQVALLVDHQRFYIADHASKWATNAPAGALHILEPATGSYKGTADAVYQNLGYLHRYGADRALVLAGDHVYRMDYRKMLAFHEQMNADVTVGVVEVPIEQAHRFGAVSVDSNNRIVEFVEKSGIPHGNLVSMGMYIFNVDKLSDRLAQDAAQPLSPHDFGYAVMPGMVKKDNVFAYRFDGYWQDIGNVEAYHAANMELVGDTPAFTLDGARPVLGEDLMAAPPRISGQGSVINSIIGPGCVVKGRVENSILSPGVWVEEQAIVTNSVIMTDSFIGYHSVVDHCVLDEEVNVGKLCYVGFKGSSANGTHDITVLGKGSTVPAHTAIGANCRVLPNVSHCDFNAAMVPPGTVISPRADGNTNLVEEKVAIK